MELEARLRAFAALARRGSFSAAADDLAISQPAVSKHIAALEAEVRTSLVRRGPRQVALTAAGAYLAEVVLRAEALLVQGGRGLRAFAADEPTTLAIAVSGTPGTYLLPRVVRAFRESQPNVSLSTELGTSAAAVEAVRTHRAELAVVGGLAAAPGLEVEPLLVDEIVVVAPPGTRPTDLGHATWISREEGSATRDAVEAAWRSLGIVPRGHLELPSWEAVKLAVAAGAGVAAISRLAIEVEQRAGTLAILDVRGWQVARPISVVRVEGLPLSPGASAFVELLRASASGGDSLDPAPHPA